MLRFALHFGLLRYHVSYLTIGYITVFTMMTQQQTDIEPSLLLMIAGAKGAVAGTVAVATATMGDRPFETLGGLTTADKFSYLGPPKNIICTGWDCDKQPLPDALAAARVLPADTWQPYSTQLAQLDIRPAPLSDQPLNKQVEAVRADIDSFRDRYPNAKPVLINLLPAACEIGLTDRHEDIHSFMSSVDKGLPDLAYAIAAVLAGVPVVNYAPNTIEISALCNAARERGVPLAGRDGKSGQTYLKVVLASAFKARSLKIDGWYSLNILGNADGKNLMDPDNACGKLQNKTNLLDEMLGYPVGERFHEPAHRVHIDYYPPRGDAKEAWDVIDFSGLLGLPMSLRLNLQGRDSILAAPMVIDLARWAAALHAAGVGGPIADLGFFFKKPIGPNPPLTFQDQLAALHRLEQRLTAKMDAS